MAIYYRARCQYCGKLGGNIAPGTPTGGTPQLAPTVQGKCPSSPTGKHAPKWEPK